MLARKVKLKLNKTQASILAERANQCSIVYNALLKEQFDRIDAGEKILSYFDLTAYCARNEHFQIGIALTQGISKKVFEAIKR